MAAIGALKPPSIFMTPELKIACEIVFQEHKTSPDPILWSKNAFRGRISIGLREMAKETLVRKNVIYYLNPVKKINTLLNPAAVEAATFEEAIQLVQNKMPVLLASTADQRPAYIPMKVSTPINLSPKPTLRLVKITGEPETAITKVKWYLKPIFYYVVWPLCSAAVSILIAYLISSVNF
jgi:hypothetical protein